MLEYWSSNLNNAHLFERLQNQYTGEHLDRYQAILVCEVELSEQVLVHEGHAY